MATDTTAVWDGLRTDLWNYFRKRVRDDHAADDLLQETFLRVHRRLAEGMEAERISAWVYGIARNVLVDHYRANGRPTSELADDSAEPEPDGTPDVQAEAAGWLEGFVARLPDTYREAVTLSELNGLPHAAVAEQLGLSVTAVKSRVRRGRALVKRDLEDCCRFELDRRGNVLDYERRNGECGCTSEKC
jgi:RNA polymerase sigma-70 factor (ECF subfamily)